MAQSLVRCGARCTEHPHRVLADGWGFDRAAEDWEPAPGSGLGPAEPKCDRCAQPFCRECLTPTERFTDGTRRWFCAKCHALFRESAAREARERSVTYRAARAAARTRAFLLTSVALASLVAITAGAVVATSRALARGRAVQTGAQLAATCGELTRIRSIGAIGTQGPEDALNILTYPRRAAVTLDLPQPAAAATGRTTEPAFRRGSPAAVVDECDTGLELSGATQLPLALTLTLERPGAYAQRFALWQEPSAPRASWVRDFEVLLSPSTAGGDFVPITLDRAAQLLETVEPQWFEVSRVGPGAIPRLFPEALPAQRMQVRVLSTYGSPRPRSVADGVALGEVALYGPDLEVIARNVIDSATGAEFPDAFEFVPGTISALAGRPKFVLVFNHSKSTTHVFATSGQQQNGEVTVPPGEARSIQFVAAGRPGRYEYFCKVPGHAARGLLGRIEVR